MPPKFNSFWDNIVRNILDNEKNIEYLNKLKLKIPMMKKFIVLSIICILIHIIPNYLMNFKLN